MRRLSVCLLLFASAGLHAQPAATPAKSFVPSEELNAQLPKWLRFNGEYRARAEGFSGDRFRSDASDGYLLNRFRINMLVRPTSWLRFNFQGQDARVFGKNQKPAAPPFQDRMDLRMAYVEMGDTEKGTFALRAGRQELVFGEQRLVGHVSWLNTARTFDAVRGTLRHKGYRVDAFMSSVVPIRDGDFNRFSSANKFHGLHGGMEKLVKNAVIEPYLFWKLSPNLLQERGGLGKLDSKTFGFRWAGKLPASFDYGAEMAGQRGDAGIDSVGAWAGHWRLGYTTTKLRYKPRWIAEYNYASGDENPRDGKRGTFDILYPTPHDKYGLSDQVGWKNIHHMRLGTEFKPHAKWMVLPNYHSWWLASKTDGLYHAGGALLARIATGAPGSHVGQELDAQAMYAWSKQVQIGGGFAHIIPGKFLKAATPGKHYNYPYMMLSYAF